MGERQSVHICGDIEVSVAHERTDVGKEHSQTGQVELAFPTTPEHQHVPEGDAVPFKQAPSLPNSSHTRAHGRHAGRWHGAARDWVVFGQRGNGG